MKGKIFTRDDATRMIPLLRRIATDTKACQKLIDRHERAIRALKDRSGSKVDAELADHRAKLTQLAERQASCAKELEELGCFLDDARQGIVKLYGEINSRIVYFTWMLGEPEVSFWHPIEKTHTDRQPIATATNSST
ncbi:MAG: DUF2203 domain-containing protein [Planctomycetes bacterium]|nr:DUF2203 domain-containing protein [Planctomycetota bacterium]